MFHDGGAASLELALTTIAAARSQPALAAAVRRSTRRPNDRGWEAEFIRFPRWTRLLEELDCDPECEETDDSLEELGSPTTLPNDWRLLVEREAIRQHSERQSIEIKMLSSDKRTDVIEVAQTLAELELGSAAALWIGASDGVGSVSAFAPQKPLSVRESRPWARSESRLSFEQRLPWYFRQSREFKLGDGLTAAVYAGVAIDGLDEWSQLLATARDRFRPGRRSQSERGFHGANADVLETEFEARYWSAVAEFGAGAGHTINNPLGAIAGLTERLLDAETAPDRRDSLHKIRTQVDRIHRMIRDLHLLGRADSLVNEGASLRDCLKEGVAKSAGRFADRKAPRCGFAEPVVDALIPIAKADLVRLVEELTANGMEAAGPNGFVDVRAERVEERVEIRVVDSGPGFTSAERAHAFAPFFAGRSAGRGLGMGLPVCRRIVERVGGRIVIGRERPTCVSVRLPLLSEQAVRRAA